MRKPEGREAGVTRRAHLRDHLRDAFGQVEAFRELRVDEQTNFHDRLSPPLAARSLLLGAPSLNRGCDPRGGLRGVSERCSI